MFDEAHSSHPSTFHTQDHLDRINVLIKENYQVILSEIAEKISISYGSAFSFKEAVHSLLQKQSKMFFSVDDRYMICVNRQENYVEK